MLDGSFFVVHEECLRYYSAQFTLQQVNAVREFVPYCGYRQGCHRHIAIGLRNLNQFR